MPVSTIGGDVGPLEIRNIIQEFQQLCLHPRVDEALLILKEDFDLDHRWVASSVDGDSAIAPTNDLTAYPSRARSNRHPHKSRAKGDARASGKPPSRNCEPK